MKYEAVEEEDETEIEGFYVEVKEYIEIRRVKSTLFAILAAKLILALCYLSIKTYCLITYKPTNNYTRDQLVINGLVTSVCIAAVIIIYLCLFLIAVVKNHRIMILVFAWLSIIDLLITIAIVVLAIITLVDSATSRRPTSGGLASSIVVCIGAAIVLLLTISTVVCAFELARLIDLKEKNLLV